MASNLDIGGYPFVCVPLTEADFKDVGAVYVIICVGTGGVWSVVDVGQTGELGSRIDSHERRTCCQRHCANTLWVCVYRLSSKEQRLAVEASLRARYRPPCGER